jgi:SagB-type dehydrogenase family enzyme
MAMVESRERMSRSGVPVPSARDVREAVERYHEGTKHDFNRFARSLGYLDWASQPHPFRSFDGAPAFPLYPRPDAPADSYAPDFVSYAELFERRAAPAPFSAAPLGDLLRHALGLSAWKRYGASRWSLRVNPSSGNLHPTEAYVICGAMPGLAHTPAVYHYAADRHALEQRCAFDGRAWTTACDGRPALLLIALTSIHWREAWKYGERAFRYCQHDLGHAIAAVGFGAALLRWRTTLLMEWSHREIATMTGIDRDEDFVEAEREEPGCIIAIAPSGDINPHVRGRTELVDAVRDGLWSGRASQLSEDHVQWTFIDEVARATECDGLGEAAACTAERMETCTTEPEARSAPASEASPDRVDARRIILQRRSALAFDGRSTVDRSAFFAMLSRVMPDASGRWQMIGWPPRIHFALFVHRVDDVAPGLYVLARARSVLDRLKAACGRDLLWEPAHSDLPFWCLARGDCRALAARLSCDQEIASDGFFSLGMIADFSASLDAYGPSFYRNLFWESGAVGQALYLAAEAAGARATGIGCYYDNPMHQVLGLAGSEFQSLYHFTIGAPVEDVRLTTERAYEWERVRSDG